MILFLVVFFATFKSIYAEVIPFQNDLSTIFPWLNTTWYYSNAHFKFWGNDFVGILFWQGWEQISPSQPISINGQAISCSTHLKWIYYNNQRGRRIWPLDSGNLALLRGNGWGYTDITMTWGFYTNCTGVSWYTPNTNDIYGQIDHSISWDQSFRMIAGVQYNFTTNTISGASFGHTLQIVTWQVHSWFIFDTNGGIAEFSVNIPWCQNFEISPLRIDQWQNITFLCQWLNASNYLLTIIRSGDTSPLLSQQTVWGLRATGNSLISWDYFATCTVLWSDGRGPQCGSQIPFHVWSTGTVQTGTIPQSTWCVPNFQGDITFTSSPGNTVISNSFGYYTNTTGTMLQLLASNPTHFYISGDFIQQPLSGNYITTWIITPVTLLTTNGWNYFSHRYTTGTCTYTWTTKRVYVDTTPPTLPSIITPVNNIFTCPSLPLTVTRSGASDSGAWLSHYRYDIYNNTGMVTGNLLSGTLPNTTTAIQLSTSLLPLWTHYMRISAIDYLWNTSSWTMVSFTTSSQYCSGGTGILFATPTLWLRNVDLNKIYKSDPIIIFGLTWPTLISISKWMLFINNNSWGNGTTGLVSPSDTVYIELISSNTYDTTVTSEIRILGHTGTFSVSTKKSSCTLSTSEKSIIDDIYQELKDEYNNDISKYADFLTTFQNMVEDETELNNSCTLNYLLDLIADDFDNEGVDTSNHIAPSCKEYSIWYDTTQQAYYAPEMSNRYYFINRESLIRHIDYYNPGDCHINTYSNNFRTSDLLDSMKHIAPNGKIYHLIGQYGGFSATEFTSPKYFDSLANIKRFIDLRNPSKEIWKHSIDDSFTPIVYAAPNGKEYKIYKTDRWYMSYKLLKVRYYITLSELKTHINKNNPSKR